jgi:multicomponent K+:H+ antiporter subunit D
LLLLQSAEPRDGMWLWAVVLLSGLLALVALSRAGSRLFWGSQGRNTGQHAANWARLAPVVLLLVLSVAMTVGAAPVSRYTEAAAGQLLRPAHYIAAVLAAKERP